MTGFRGLFRAISNVLGASKAEPVAAGGVPGKSIRGRFKVIELRKYDFQHRSAWVQLESEDEDQDIAHQLRSASGKASISMMVTSPQLVDSFPLGKHFDVDFTQID